MAKGRKASAGEKLGHRKPPQLPVPPSDLSEVQQDAVTAHPAPADLPPAAVDAWETCIRDMGATRNMRESDLILLRAYVIAVQIHEEAWASIRKHGAQMAVFATSKETGDVVRDSKGDPIQIGVKVNPACALRDSAAREMRYYSDMLGLNPQAYLRMNLGEAAGQMMTLDIRDRLIARMVKGP